MKAQKNKLSQLLSLFVVVALFIVPSAAAYPVEFEVTGTNLQNFNVAIFHCTDSSCSAVDQKITEGTAPLTYALPNLGSGNQWFVEYAYPINNDGYMPKASRIGVSQNTNNNDDGNPWGREVSFSEVFESCNANINSVVLSQYSVEEGNSVTVTATIQSPLEYSRVNVIPTELEQYYSNKVDAYLYANGEHISTKQVSIVMGESAQVSFSYTPTEDGAQEIEVYSKLDNDNICTSSNYQVGRTSLVVTPSSNPSENHAPVLVSAIADQSWKKGYSNRNVLDLDDFFADLDEGDVLSYSVSGNNKITVSIDSRNVVSFSQPSSWTGSESIVFTAADQDGLSVQSNSITLTVYDGNQDPTENSRPVLKGMIPNQVWEVGTDNINALDLDNYFYDPNGDSLTYSIVVVDSDVSIKVSLDSNNVLSFTQDVAAEGSATIKVIASDGELSAESNYVKLSVVDTPLHVSIGVDQRVGDIPLTVDFYADVSVGVAPFSLEWDFDNDGIIDSYDLSPSYTYTEAGRYTAKVYVTDAEGEQGVASISINAKDSSTLSEGVIIHGINFLNGEIIESGDELAVLVDLRNYADTELEDADVVVTIPELAIDPERQEIEEIDEDSDKMVRFYLDIPSNAKAGYYTVRATVSNDNIRVVRHREFRVA